MESRIEGVTSVMLLTDLGMGGGYLDTGTATAHVQPGARITITVFASHGELRVPVKVVYVRPGIGFGFEVDAERAPEDVRNALASLLD